jgi:hypothetical protein
MVYMVSLILLKQICKKNFESTLKENLNSSMKFFKTISIKNMDIEDSIPALASAIISVYDIRKNIVNNELRKRPETRRIWYNEGARKRLEYVQQKLFH